MVTKKLGNYFLILASVMLLVISGCSGKKQESAKQGGADVQGNAQEGQALPEGHPAINNQLSDMTKASHTSIKTQKEVRLSDEVKAKWKEVKLEITDSASNNKEVVNVKVGETVTLTKNGNGYKLKVEAFVPDYAIAENHIESRSNEPKNPAALVELFEGDKSVARGWVFKNFPEFNSYANEKFPMALLAPSLEKAAAKK